MASLHWSVRLASFFLSSVMKTSRPDFRFALTFAVALGLAVFSPASQAAKSPEVQRVLDGKLNPTLHTVRIDNQFGPVTVVGVDQDFGWRWILDCSGDKAKAEAFAKECQLDVKETNGTLQIHFIPPERNGGHESRSVSSWKIFGLVWTHSTSSGVDWESKLELRLPRAVTVELKDRFGHVSVASIRGPLNLECQNAAVEIADIASAVTASTTFASLHVERTGPAQLHNQNGAVHAAGIDGDLRVVDSFGRTSVQDVKGRAELKNQNGEIEAANIAGDLVASSSFGHIRVHDIEGSADLRNQNASIEARKIRRDVQAESSFANMRVEDVGGGATLKCQNGQIDALRIGNTVTASNSFAGMHVEDVHGDATLESQNGEIVAHGVTGAVHAKTSFARMQLEGEGKRFDAHNQNGAVQITARSPGVERIAATTSFGPIDVRLPRDCKPLIRANTSFGKVNSDFPVVLSDTLPEAAFNADAAQPKITLRGQNGDIRVKLLASQ
jgi:DUF4097 and DUF4098 domain-containing protein YvlB